MPESLIERLRHPIDRLGRQIRSRISPSADYLASYGWFHSRKSRRPIDQSGAPIPWITYPALSVLRKIVGPHHRVFEYGCGNSSLWWAAHAASVMSVEHDEAWARRISSQAPQNLTVVPIKADDTGARCDLVEEFFVRNPELPSTGFRELDLFHGLRCREFSAYAAEITKHPVFDIVIVDGMARSLCAWMAAHHVTPDGIVVFDNSDRWQYNPGYMALAERGFGRVDFVGPGPVDRSPWCTSIFYRTAAWSAPLISIDPAASPCDLDRVSEAWRANGKLPG